ncbi:hypothetical protein [Streptomyces pharetrae]|uniref:hypothetical protein n=1 Tax=Streptomyces pharetrae TaxID=291370 RepID=UPI001302215C
MSGVQVPQFVAEDDELPEGCGPFLDDDQVEVVELHPQAGDVEFVGEPFEAQFDGPSAALGAHLLAHRVADLLDAGGGPGPDPQGGVEPGRQTAHGEPVRARRGAAAGRTALCRAPGSSIAPLPAAVRAPHDGSSRVRGGSGGDHAVFASSCSTH